MLPPPARQRLCPCRAKGEWAGVLDLADQPLLAVASGAGGLMDALLSLPLWLIGVLVVAFGVLVSSAGAILTDRSLSPLTLSESNVVGGFNFSFLEPLLAVILFYMLPLTWANYNSLSDQIGIETSALTALERTAGGLGAPLDERLTAAVRGYAAAVATSEWPAMKDGRSSPEAAAALERLTAIYGSARAAGPSENIALRMSQQLLAKVVESRSLRLAVAEAKEGPLSWAISVIATLSVFTFAWFFGLPTLATKLVMGGVFAMAVMLVVYVVFVLRDPFSGTLGLTANPYLELAG
jgi:Protein of unknown function (DUF4239)